MTTRFFVGRRDELATLHTHLADARAGRGSLVTLVGEPGIGKTRTVEELVARADLGEDRVIPQGRSAHSVERRSTASERP
jgi:predicted ATPase